MQYPDIGERIRQCRINARLTQEELAELARLSRVTIAKYESGRIEPGINAMMRIADAFGITVDELLGNAPLPEQITAKPKNENISAIIRVLNQLPEKEQEKALNMMRIVFDEYSEHFEKGTNDNDA